MHLSEQVEVAFVDQLTLGLTVVIRIAFNILKVTEIEISGWLRSYNFWNREVRERIHFFHDNIPVY